ncbi:MAG: SDR family oxidoreductase [Nitrospiraceae bacterium]|nr:SDR family oxidoreductase [Nitrospiraceae bacterium]
MFGLNGKVAVVTAGGGVLCGCMAKGFASAGAKVAVADLRADTAEAVAEEIRAAGGDARSYEMDAFSKDSLTACCESIYTDFGQVDVLVNGVGGNMKGATTSDEQSFFDLPADALQKVVALNLVAGAVVPSQVFLARMKDNENGASVINISSMNAFTPLTRIPGYSAAKAAVSNFTQWLAVHMAQEYSPKVRVNAIAPGFFLTDQNRFLVMDKETGKWTPRGQSIVEHTPMGEFGAPEDLLGAALWLASDASRFVTGIVVPVDGGFSAFSGV